MGDGNDGDSNGGDLTKTCIFAKYSRGIFWKPPFRKHVEQTSLTHTPTHFVVWTYVLRLFDVDKTQSIATTNPQHMLYSSPVILRVTLQTLSVSSSFYTCRALNQRIQTVCWGDIFIVTILWIVHFWQGLQLFPFQIKWFNQTTWFAWLTYAFAFVLPHSISSWFIRWEVTFPDYVCKEPRKNTWQIIMAG